MKTKLNCHRVLAGTATRRGFVQELEVKEAKEKSLRNARDLVRERLRDGFANWQSLIDRRHLFEHSVLGQAQTPPTLRPRFRMQGSFVYRTVNQPAYIPQQDIDLDDGLYLPTSFVTGNGEIAPAIASRGFFILVEKILDRLCEERGWKLDRTKSTCVRIVVADDAHIDLPLYAIPDGEFQTLIETAAAMERDVVAKQSIVVGLDILEKAFRELPEDKIVLAHRIEGWKLSDPRKIEDWFLAATRSHGEVLRRICRYLKGWRDFQWENGKLSSIAIMAMVVSAIDALRGTLPQNRDDVALLEVVNALPNLLRQQIPNPIPDLPALDEGWNDDDRRDMVERADRLRTNVHNALHGGFVKSVALKRLADEFGDRIPSDQMLITVNDEEAEVLSHEPARVASPMIGRTVSG